MTFYYTVLVILISTNFSLANEGNYKCALLNISFKIIFPEDKRKIQGKFVLIFFYFYRISMMKLVYPEFKRQIIKKYCGYPISI